MYKIYCDAGGYNNKLEPLKEKGLVKVIYFPLQNRISETKASMQNVVPSEFLIWNSDGIWSDSIYPFRKYDTSDKHAQIVHIVCPQNKPNISERLDINQLDTAYINKADFFFTSDIHDIGKNKAPLEELLGFKIINPHQESQWKFFLNLIK